MKFGQEIPIRLTKYDFRKGQILRLKRSENDVKGVYEYKVIGLYDHHALLIPMFGRNTYSRRIDLKYHELGLELQE